MEYPFNFYVCLKIKTIFFLFFHLASYISAYKVDSFSCMWSKISETSTLEAAAVFWGSQRFKMH